jgi:hypothetical protein
MESTIQGSMNVSLYADLDLSAIDRIRQQHDKLADQEDWLWHVGIGPAVACRFHSLPRPLIEDRVLAGH